LLRDLGVGVQRPSDERIEWRRHGAAGEIGAALIELDKRALDLLLMELLRGAGERIQQDSGSEDYRLHFPGLSKPIL
jgi:hypothetical protein